MKYFDAFSGIGGFALGINNAYETYYRLHSRQKWESSEEDNMENSRNDSRELGTWGKHRPICIGYSEINKYASAVYQKHFPDHKNYGDITKIIAEDLPDFDLLVGGFPCQAFSIAGKRKGFNDTRGTLFFDLARILRAKKPRLFVFENVKGLLSHDNGQTFTTIIATLDELGYDLQWQVLNSKNHGVPQNRERVFIVGHLRGTPRPKVFPFGEDGGEINELPRHISNTLTARYEGAQAVGTYIGESKLNAQEINQLNSPTHSNDRVYGTDGVSPTLNTMQGGNRQPFIAEQMQIRRLTPIECERLQGFPDGWTAGQSDTQRYKMCGNAVTTNVIRDIMSKIII